MAPTIGNNLTGSKATLSLQNLDVNPAVSSLSDLLGLSPMRGDERISTSAVKTLQVRQFQLLSRCT